LEEHDFDIFRVCGRFVGEEVADLTGEPVALVGGLGSAPLILYGNGEICPVEECVPDSEVKFGL
jgi:hypothetical protein